MSTVTLGDRVVDRVTGWSGIITGRLEYLNGCRQFLVKPEHLDKDGKMVDGIWLDEQYLMVLDKGVLPDPFAVSPDVQRGGPNRAERDLPR